MSLNFPSFLSLVRISFALLVVELFLAAIFGRLVMLETLYGGVTLLAVALTEGAFAVLPEAPMRSISPICAKCWHQLQAFRLRMSHGDHLAVLGAARILTPVLLLGLLALIGIDRRVCRGTSENEPAPPDKEKPC